MRLLEEFERVKNAIVEKSGVFVECWKERSEWSSQVSSTIYRRLLNKVLSLKVELWVGSNIFFKRLAKHHSYKIFLFSLLCYKLASNSVIEVDLKCDWKSAILERIASSEVGQPHSRPHSCNPFGQHCGSRALAGTTPRSNVCPSRELISCTNYLGKNSGKKSCKCHRKF